MIRCRICGKIVEMSNREAEIISQYGEKTAQKEGMIRCDWTECDDCIEEENRREQLFREQFDFERGDWKY